MGAGVAGLGGVRVLEGVGVGVGGRVAAGKLWVVLGEGGCVAQYDPATGQELQVTTPSPTRPTDPGPAWPTIGPVKWPGRTGRSNGPATG